VAERPEPQARVALGQKALLKLGYGPLKADGLMGPGTRQALERFERDHKLPVTGELSGRTLRALAAQSNTTIE
jgi:peptidoglycan hydrolase-like protein with peptidoglycan-binding domain